jgi:hypothetical protein
LCHTIAQNRRSFCGRRGIGRRMEIGEVDEALIAECAEQLKGL